MTDFAGTAFLVPAPTGPRRADGALWCGHPIEAVRVDASGVEACAACGEEAPPPGVSARPVRARR